MYNDETGTVKHCYRSNWFCSTRNRERLSEFYRAVSTGGASKHEVVTDRAMEAWYHPSIA
jgi:hypothetical protein